MVAWRILAKASCAGEGGAAKYSRHCRDSPSSQKISGRKQYQTGNGAAGVARVKHPENGQTGYPAMAAIYAGGGGSIREED